MLDRITIRELENGFLVKYHVQTARTDAAGNPAEAGYTKEIFAPDREELVKLIVGIAQKEVLA